MREGLRPAEDDLVKRAVSELPPMSDEAFAAGRARLMARMGRTVDTAVETQSVTTAEAESIAVPQPRRRSRHVAWLAAAAVVVGVLVLTLVGPTLVPKGGDVDSGPEPRIGSAVAAEALSQAASKTGDVVLQPGQFLYVRNHTMAMASGGADENHIGWAYTQDETYETWVPADQGQTWETKRSSTGRKTLLVGSPDDFPKDMPDLMPLGEWKARGGAFWGQDDLPAAFTRPTPAYLAALTRDPKKLYEKLRSEAAGDQGHILLTEISEGLDTGLIPADLRKAVFQALAYLPNLQVLGGQADFDGRSGTGFGLVDDATQYELIIDPATGTYLGWKEMQVRDAKGLKAGTVVNATALSTKVVGAMGQS
ncbi:CU044_5270 family protein [Kutzneria sp. CA-103260]|uniref:CU044_5270 family protein n=1 Tax=Kutzneria sp. CA-103260 TaxID=2802641 RepID=UPI001BAE0BA6|nr:CU044_5270 family protein [Kutzneria sp. CA-103260]QUQ63451.1 hypothetical protein JJ691_11630 [Kutzneria sp. CA-103260]